eukprot:3696818-Prymnesium_polylepis.1
MSFAFPDALSDSLGRHIDKPGNTTTGQLGLQEVQLCDLSVRLRNPAQPLIVLHAHLDLLVFGREVLDKDDGVHVRPVLNGRRLLLHRRLVGHRLAVLLDVALSHAKKSAGSGSSPCRNLQKSPLLHLHTFFQLVHGWLCRGTRPFASVLVQVEVSTTSSSFAGASDANNRSMWSLGCVSKPFLSQLVRSA